MVAQTEISVTSVQSPSIAIAVFIAGNLMVLGVLLLVYMVF
ncbi:MAG TPA: hypothetical protein VIM16_23005 [Mucilaginibacter sp.]|jgi:hypothetical protein